MNKSKAKKASLVQRAIHFIGRLLAGKIAKHSILPATVFNKLQIQTIEKEFRGFWNLAKTPVNLKPYSQFSTFTLAQPKSLWTYYFPTKEKIDALRMTYNLEPFCIKGSENSQLCGTLFKHKNGDDTQARTIIFFNGNGELYKIGAAGWLFKTLLNSETPFNIVMFDHRECGNSLGKAHPNGLVEDGNAIFQYVTTALGIDKDNIDLIGFSLGAAIATIVKEQNPSKGALISNRSFETLEKTITGYFKKSLSTTLFSKLAIKISQSSGWALDPFSAWKKIPTRKMVICHELDPIIAHEASLENAINKTHSSCHSTIIRLRQKNPNLKIRNHHVEPLGSYNDDHGNDVEEQILHFLNQTQPALLSESIL